MTLKQTPITTTIFMVQNKRNGIVRQWSYYFSE